MNETGLYIHIPFCRRKCRYCDFYSLPADNPPGEEYARAVIRNIKVYNEKYDTVYFGGGTPSLMPPALMGNILDSAHITAGAEITMEANPDSVNEKKLREYRAAGIDRISIGVQSFKDSDLERLGRLHNGSTAVKAIESAYKAGFENISADLMTGLPFQDKKAVSENIDILSSLPVSHVSAYMLKIEEGTPISRDSGFINACGDDEEAADIYAETVDRLKEKGFFQYEISNFSKKGCECRHNLKYWRCEDYIGIGPAAHSCYKGKRFAVPRDLRGFTESPSQREEITDPSPLSEGERMMLALRLTEGFDMKGRENLAKPAERLKAAGLCKIINGRISLTVKGMLVSNRVILYLQEYL